MDLWTTVLAQCPCSGGSRFPLATFLGVVAALWVTTCWAESIKKKEGTFRMVSKLAKLAVVVALVAAVGTVLAMKKARTAAPAATPTDPVVQASVVQAPNALPRLLDLGSTSCIPCKMMAPILEQLKAEQAGKLQVDFIDVWKDKPAGERYGVHVIPCQIFFDASGKEALAARGLSGQRRYPGQVEAAEGRTGRGRLVAARGRTGRSKP